MKLTFNTANFVLALLLTFIMSINLSCIAGWTLEPARQKKPITMFNGKYVLKVFGVQGSSHSTISRFVNGIEPIGVDADTPPSALDTIPIFVLDSVCFLGDCLDPEFCRLAMLKIEDYMELSGDGFAVFKNLPEDVQTSWRRKFIWPSDIFWTDNIRIPLYCGDGEVTGIFYARLIDRKTGKSIEGETKSVEFKIKKSKYLYGG